MVVHYSCGSEQFLLYAAAPLGQPTKPNVASLLQLTKYKYYFDGKSALTASFPVQLCLALS
jgi:hypothetical protein